MRGLRDWTGRPRRIVLATLAVCALALTAQAQEDKPLSDSMPARDLVVYYELDGLARHREDWQKTALYKILTQTKTGAMFEELGRGLLDIAMRSMGPREAGPSRREAMAMLRHVVDQGGVLGILNVTEGEDQADLIENVRPQPADGKPAGIIVLRGAGAGEAGTLFGDYLARLADQSGEAERVEGPGGRQATKVGDSWGYWVENDDLILIFGKTRQAAEAVIAVLDDGAPTATSHPLRQKLVAANEGAVKPVELGFIDFNLIPEDQARGLEGIDSISFTNGFQDEAMVSSFWLNAPAPRKGVWTLLDQPTFSAATMPPIPESVTSYTVVSLDFVKVLDALSRLPEGPENLDEMTREFQRNTGLDLREDVLSSVGPLWAFYAIPQTVSAPSMPAAGLLSWLTHPPKLAAVVQVRDRAGLERSLDELMGLANRAMRESGPPDLPPARFEPLKGGRSGYIADIPPAVFPLPAGVRPVIEIGEQYAVLAISPEVASQALGAKPSPSPALEALGDKLFLVSQDDPRGSVPELIANVPFILGLISMSAREEGAAPPLKMLAQIRIDPETVPDPETIRPLLFPNMLAASVDDEGVRFTYRYSMPGLNMGPASTGVMVALLLPAVQAAREAARRAQCMNNLKQIGLAMHNHHSVYDRFPPAASRDSDGKPLLSWRVAILPFIEQNTLYEQFHLDEPWDSPHNIQLLEKMPVIYGCPSGTMAPGETGYQVVTGPAGLFANPAGPQFREITDGTSNTLMVVETPSGVPWTKPDDLELDEDGPLPVTGSNHANGFNALFGDGSVRFITNTIAEEVLRALLTPNGGEVISGDQIP